METTLTVYGFLIVRANGEIRVTKKRVNLRIDEVAFPLTVTIPHTWGRVQPTRIDVALPDPPEPRVSVGGGQVSDEPFDVPGVDDFSYTDDLTGDDDEYKS